MNQIKNNQKCTIKHCHSGLDGNVIKNSVIHSGNTTASLPVSPGDSIKINNREYYIHPIYDLYGADQDGNINNIIKKVPIRGNINHCGYLMCNIRKYAQPGQKAYQAHRFVYQCYNGIIPEGQVIDHINNIKDDNRLSNLQIMTQQENCKKSAKDRDYTFVSNNHKNKKSIKAINKDTNKVTYFNSLYAVQQHLGINSGIVKMVCKGRNHCKSGLSTEDGCSYTFEYINREDLLEHKFKKSANIRPRRISDDDKKEAFKKMAKQRISMP